MTEYHLSLPGEKDTLLDVRVGDVLFVTGRLFTARDQAHRLLLETSDDRLPFDPNLMMLYHCGPLMEKTKQGWNVVSAGPTTSMRMEAFESRVLQRFSLPLIIGKGGMGEKTQMALQKQKSVYAVFPGGAGVVAAQCVTQVVDVFWLDELFMPEAIWVFDVQEFGPLVVTMDATGDSLT